jgi:hypothetical protein
MFALSGVHASVRARFRARPGQPAMEFDMASDERSKMEQEQKPDNVRQFVPRNAASASKNKDGPSGYAGLDSLRRDQGVLDDDDDPGPSAA